MITTRTPLRISLVGGGTDFPDFYTENGGGVISMAIDKYIYISVNRKFDGNLRLSYSKTENVKDADELEHDLVRTTLQLMQEGALEITSVSDIPGEGSGLGSSSAFTVGLMLALSERWGHRYSPHVLAENAYMIESMLCGHHVGKQDQYAAAHGGFKFYQFMQDGSVRVEPFCLLDEELDYIGSRTMLFWTGKTRKAEGILREQEHGYNHDGYVIDAARHIRDMAFQLHDEIQEHNLDNIGEYISASWEYKKRLAGGVSEIWIDGVIKKAMKAGASGSKLCGAGGGGFLLVYAEPEKQEAITKDIGLRRVPIKIDEFGSTVIYNGNNYISYPKNHSKPIPLQAKIAVSG